MKTVEGFRLRRVMGQDILIGEGIGLVNFNKLITLNPSATYLWRSVEGTDFSVEQLAELLEERYCIDPAIAYRDAFTVAEEWIKNGVVHR